MTIGSAFLYRVALSAQESQVAAFEAALSQGALSLANFEAAPGGPWCIEALVPDGADIVALRARVLVVAAAVGVEPPEVTVKPLPETDWVAATLAGLPAVRTGRYRVHGAHLPPAASGAVDIEVDAGPAFGTGEHESTRGCLVALEGLARRRRVHRALDMGCGSGILAMAIAKTWRAAVIAADIDPVAVRTARENARRNGVGRLIDATVSDGYRGAALRRHAPYDLIVANILARPLIAMASGLARHLAPAGVAILSGLLTRQAPAVLMAHRAQGLALAGRIALGDWQTLVMARRVPG